jgi:glutamate-1-semialdehyde aminotransferase
MFVFKDATGADDLVLKSLFIQETAKQGVLTSTSNMMNYSHEKRDIEEVAKRFDKVFAIMAKAIKEGRVLESLEGPPVRPRNKPTN